MLHDILSKLHPLPAIDPQSVADNTPLVSAWIDTQGEDSLLFAIAIGAVADANATFAVTMDHADADNQSDAAAVPAGQMNGTLALAGFQFDDDSKTRKVGYIGNKRWVRLTITPSANGSAALIGAIAILVPAILPPPNPPV